MLKMYMPKADENKALQENYFNYAEATTRDVLGATFSQALYENPANAAYRSAELFFRGKTGRKLTSEEYAQSEYYRPGITVGEQGMYESTASILAERFDEREGRKMVMARARGGFGLGASQFGVGFVASMMDPLNIAASFIPVVGQARYASMLARNGKTVARLKRGLAEGAVGAAVVEPLVIGAAAYEQDADYTMADSLLNITFGTALGGGLHVGFGRIGDALSRTSSDVRVAAHKTALAQTIENKQVDVDPVLSADPVLRNDPAFIGDKQIPEYALPEPLRNAPRKGNRIPTPLRPALVADEAPKTLTQFIRSIGGVRADDVNVADVRQIIDKDRTIISKKAKLKRGKKGEGPRLGPAPMSLDEIGEAAFEAGYFPNRPDIPELLEAFEADFKGSPRYNDYDVDFIESKQQAEALVEEFKNYGIDYKGLSDEDFYAILENRRAVFERAREIPADTPDGMTPDEHYDLRMRLQKEQNPVTQQEFEAMAAADLGADRFDEDVLNRLTEENEALVADINFLIEEGADPADFSEGLVVYERMAVKADEGYDNALRAAQNCLSGETK